MVEYNQRPKRSRTFMEAFGRYSQAQRAPLTLTYDGPSNPSDVGTMGPIEEVDDEYTEL